MQKEYAKYADFEHFISLSDNMQNIQINMQNMQNQRMKINHMHWQNMFADAKICMQPGLHPNSSCIAAAG
jgi:hypothetical protein